MHQFKSLLISVTLISLLGSNAFAYYEVMDTGDILPTQNRAVMTQAQMAFGSNLKSNVVGSYDWPLDDSSQIRTFIGLGETFHIGGSYKWMPVPDYQKQPAMGVIFSGHFAQPSSSSEFALSAAGMFSKYVQTQKLGTHNLYVSPKLSLQFYDGNSNLPLQLVGGTQFDLKQFKNAKINAEIGFNLSKSFNYIAVGFVVEYNEFDGLTLQKN